MAARPPQAAADAVLLKQLEVGLIVPKAVSGEARSLLKLSRLSLQVGCRTVAHRRATGCNIRLPTFADYVRLRVSPLHTWACHEDA